MGRLGSLPLAKGDWDNPAAPRLLEDQQHPPLGLGALRLRLHLRVLGQHLANLVVWGPSQVHLVAAQPLGSLRRWGRRLRLASLAPWERSRVRLEADRLLGRRARRVEVLLVKHHPWVTRVEVLLDKRRRWEPSRAHLDHQPLASHRSLRSRAQGGVLLASRRSRAREVVLLANRRRWGRLGRGLVSLVPWGQSPVLLDRQREAQGLGSLPFPTMQEAVHSGKQVRTRVRTRTRTRTRARVPRWAGHRIPRRHLGRKQVPLARPLNRPLQAHLGSLPSQLPRVLLDNRHSLQLRIRFHRRQAKGRARLILLAQDRPPGSGPATRTSRTPLASLVRSASLPSRHHRHLDSPASKRASQRQVIHLHNPRPSRPCRLALLTASANPIRLEVPRRIHLSAATPAVGSGRATGYLRKGTRGWGI